MSVRPKVPKVTDRPHRLPEWARNPARGGTQLHELKRMFRSRRLHTVCEEARCPNQGECWANRTATFMILGDSCTRFCGFCSVSSGTPVSLDSLRREPEMVAQSAQELRLKYVVITSVNRDDLPDGGAGHFARTIEAVRARIPECVVEVLIPDFLGDERALQTVLDARPDTLNHNVETIPRLYKRVRPQANYERSLQLLARSKRLAPGIITKSGVMVGHGETPDEVREVMRDLRTRGVDIVTIGQYLRPTMRNLPVVEYVHPEVFIQYQAYGTQLGFKSVFAGPLVRSSYHAGEVFRGSQTAASQSRG